MNEIKGAMNNHLISYFKHISDINNKRDLLLSTSYEGGNLKVRNIKNWEFLCIIKQSKSFLFFFFFCFLNENNQNYVLIINNHTERGPEISAFAITFKGYNLEGIKIISLTDFERSMFFIDTYGGPMTFFTNIILFPRMIIYFPNFIYFLSQLLYFIRQRYLFSFPNLYEFLSKTI